MTTSITSHNRPDVVAALDVTSKRPPSEAALASTVQDIAGARDFYRSLGFGPGHGTSPVRVIVEPAPGWLGRKTSAAAGAYSKTLDAIRAKPGAGANARSERFIAYHEYGHRVTWAAVPDLKLTGETGTVAEHISNTFAMTGTGIDELRIGSKTYQMAEPRSLRAGIGRLGVPMPDHVRDFVSTSLDSGGAHINWGILDRAAVQMARDPRLGARRVAQLYADAVRMELQPDTNLSQWAAGTQRSAARLFGPGSPQSVAVGDAWLQAGFTDAMLEGGEALRARGFALFRGDRLNRVNTAVVFGVTLGVAALASAALIGAVRGAAQVARRATD